MAAARLAASLLVFLTTALTAQNTSTSQVVITVIDQSGAVIPGAHIGIVALPEVVPGDGDWRHYAWSAPEQTSTETNASGEAAVGLARGSYAAVITVPGFKRGYEKIEGGDASQFLRATLVVAPTEDPISIKDERPEVPLEPTFLNIFIPLVPLQTVAPTRRLRRR